MVELTEQTYIAHVRKHDGTIQTVEHHLQGVAQLSKRFAAKIGLPLAGMLIGLAHDLGKYSEEFQWYIRGACEMLGKEEKERADALKGKVDHATAGAQIIWEVLSDKADPVSLYVAQILAICVASHHSGLSDFIALNGLSPFFERMKKSKDRSFVDEVKLNCDFKLFGELRETLSSNGIVDELKLLLRQMVCCEKNEVLRQFHFGLLLRFLFSCLIDADRLNTINFEKPKSAEYRNTDVLPDWKSLTERFEAHLAAFKSRNQVDELRNTISNLCLDAASRPKGVFTLTVPTGGGKTLASLRFALHHAMQHSSAASDSPFERIIFVIPYTSIIEQNAEAVRKILGDNNVLEHHSNLVPDKDTWLTRLLSENWDAPIVFTTSVQFLNALFASSTRDVRRMHQLANSIIIFDEIQTLPIKTIHLFNNAVNFLTQTCGSSIVFCTATQPLLDRVDVDRGAVRLNPNSKIINDDYKVFEELRRTQIRDCRKSGGWTVQEVADLSLNQVKETGSALIVVNTKASALALYKKLCSTPDIKVYHLSTNMCPTHRKGVLATIRSSLDSGCQQPIICISTQLIEAGVDIDFGSVIRYLAGLDSIAQAAGRCNRHGRISGLAPVFIVNPAKENIENLSDIKKGQEITNRILDDFRTDPALMGNDLISPKAMNQFYKYYFFKRSEEMTYPIYASSEIECDTTLLDLLSQNSTSLSNYKRTNKASPAFPLRQAFATAARSFRIIDAPTEGIIVPYSEEGRLIIAELSSAFTNPDCSIEIQKNLLRRAQPYSVNVFPNLLMQLHKKGCVYEVQKGSGIYYLDERHYSDAFGISLEETMGMTFLNV